MEELKLKEWLSKKDDEYGAVSVSLKSYFIPRISPSLEAYLWIFDGINSVRLIYDIESLADKREALDNIYKLRSLISHLYRAIKNIPDEQLQQEGAQETECSTVSTANNLSSEDNQSIK